ncbi:MAG: hypothetical protein NC115_01870 [Bacteroidales bacterium]|nr:hypothetical protein [Bacteroidales bacterium]
MDKDTIKNKCHEAIASLLKMALDINGAPVSDNLLFIKGYEIGVCDDFHRIETERFEQRILCGIEDVMSDIYGYMSAGKNINMISFDMYCTSVSETVITVFLIFSDERTGIDFHLSVKPNMPFDFNK